MKSTRGILENLMLRKIIHCGSLEDAVSFAKVTSLQCSDCNFTIKRTHHRFFLDYVRQASCLKNNENRKSIFLEVYGEPAS